MTVTQAVISRLSAISALTALVSTRIYQLILPETVTLPAVLVTRIDTVEDSHLRGGGAMYRTRVQIDAVVDARATSPLVTANAIERAISGPGDGTGLSGFKGIVPSGSPAFAIAGVQALDVRDGYAGDELRQVRVSRDFYVWHPAAA